MPITADSYAVVLRLLDSYESHATNNPEEAPLQADVKYTIASLRTFAANPSRTRTTGLEQNGRLNSALSPLGENSEGEIAKPPVRDREEIQIFSFHSTPKRSKDFGLILRQEEAGHLVNRPSRKPWRRSIALGAEQTRSPRETALGQLRVELILPTSYLKEDGRLRQGDELLSINGQVLVNCDELKASKLLDNALKSGSVCLAVLRKVKRRAPLPPGKRNSIASVVDITNRTPTSPEIPETLPPSEAISQLENFTNSILHRRSNSLKVRGNNYPGTGTSRASGTLDPRKAGDAAKRRAPETPQGGGVYYPGGEMPIRKFNKTKGSSHHQTLPSVISRSDSVLSRTITEAKRRKREVVKIHLVKDRGSLGIQIAGGKNSSKGDVGIFVAGLDPGSPAERDGRLEKGDEILMINGNSLLSVTHRDVAQLLGESGSIVQLVLARKRKRKKRTHLNGSGTSDTSDSSSMSSQFSTPRGSPAIPSKQYHSQESLVRGGGGLSSGSASPLSVGSPMIPSRALEQRHRLEVPESSWRSVTTSPLSPMKSEDKRSFGSRGDLPPFQETIEISLMKGGFGQGLGFNIIDRGRGGIFVRSIFPGGPAAADGRLREEDEILTVNGESLEGLSQQQAIAKFKQVKKGLVTLTVTRGAEPPSPTVPGGLILPPPRRKRKKSQSEDGSLSPGAETRVIREVTIINERGSYFGVSVICLPIPDKAHESGVYIHDLAPNSPAEKTGQLCIGALVSELNGQSLHNANSTNSVQYLFDNLPLGPVKLKLSMYKNLGKSRSELGRAQELALRLGKSPEEERKNLVPRRDTLTSEATGSKSMVAGSSPPPSGDKDEEIGATTGEVQYRSADSGDSNTDSPTRRNRTGGNRQGGKRRAMVVLSTETLPLAGDAVIKSSPPEIPPHKSPPSRPPGDDGKTNDYKRDLRARHIYDEVALEPMEEGPPGLLHPNADSSWVDTKDMSVGNKRLARIGSEMSRQFEDYVRQTIVEDVEAERRRRKVPEDVLRKLRHLCLKEDLWMLRLERSPGERLGMGLNIEHTQEDNSLTEGVFIKSIHPGGAAARLNQGTGGGLYEGDEIVMANDLVLKKRAYNEVVKHLSILPDEFSLVVARRSISEVNSGDGVSSLLPKEEDCLWDKIERHLGTKLPRSEADVDSSEEVELKRLWQRLESELMNLTDSAESLSSNQGTDSTRPFSNEFRSKLGSDRRDQASSPESLEDGGVSVSDMSDTEERWVQRCNGNQSDDDDDDVLSSESEGQENFTKLDNLLSMNPGERPISMAELSTAADDTPCFTPESLSPRRKRQDAQERMPQSDMCEAIPVTDIDDILSLSEEEGDFTTSTPAVAAAREGIAPLSAGNGNHPFLERLLDSEPGSESPHGGGGQGRESASPSIVTETIIALQVQADVETIPKVGEEDSEMLNEGDEGSANDTHIGGDLGYANSNGMQLSRDGAGQTESPVVRYRKNQARGASKGPDSSVYVSPLSSPEKGKGEFRLSSTSANLSVSTYSLSDLSITDTDSDALSMQSNESPLRSVKATKQLPPVQSGPDSQVTRKRLIKADNFSFEDSSDEELTVEVGDTHDGDVSNRSDVTMKLDESNITLGSESKSAIDESSPGTHGKSARPDKEEDQFKETPTSPRLPPDGHEFPQGVTCSHDDVNNLAHDNTDGRGDSSYKGLYIDTAPSNPEPKRRIPASPFVVSPEKSLFAPLFESTPENSRERNPGETTPVSAKESPLNDLTKRHSTSPKSPGFSTQNKYFPELAGDAHKGSEAAALPSRAEKSSGGQRFFSNLATDANHKLEPISTYVGEVETAPTLDSDDIDGKQSSEASVEELTAMTERGVPSSAVEEEGEFVKSSMLLNKLRSDLKKTSGSSAGPIRGPVENMSSQNDLPSEEKGDGSKSHTAGVNSQKLAVPKRLSAVLGKSQGGKSPANTGYEFPKSGARSGDQILAPCTKFLEEESFTGFVGYRKFSWEQDIKKRESAEVMPPVRKGSFKDNSDIKKRLAARLRKLPVTELPDDERLPGTPQGMGGGGVQEVDMGSHIREKKPRLDGGMFEPSVVAPEGFRDECPTNSGDDRTVIGGNNGEERPEGEPQQPPKSLAVKKVDEENEQVIDREISIEGGIVGGCSNADGERGLSDKELLRESGHLGGVDSSRQESVILSGDGISLSEVETSILESEKLETVQSGDEIVNEGKLGELQPKGDERLSSLRPTVMGLGVTGVTELGLLAKEKVDDNLDTELSQKSSGAAVTAEGIERGRLLVEDEDNKNQRHLDSDDNLQHEQDYDREHETDTDVLSSSIMGVNVVPGESSIFPLSGIHHMIDHQNGHDHGDRDADQIEGSVQDDRIDVGVGETSTEAPPPLPTLPPPLLTSPMPGLNTKTEAQESASGETDVVDSDVCAEDLGEGVFEIVIDKKPGELLGIQIEGGSDTARQCIYVDRIHPDSAASRSGRLRRGDQLLDVNGTCMVGISYVEAMDVLLNHPKGPLHMVISRQRQEDDPSSADESSGMEDLASELLAHVEVERSDEDDDLSTENRECFDSPDVYSPTCPDSPDIGGTPQSHFKPMSSTPDEGKENLDAGSDRLSELQIRAVAKRKMIKEGVHPRYLQRSMSESSNSTVLLSTTELDKLIDDANQSLEENDDSNVSVIVLHKEEELQGLGLTVAGGIDQEVREITVHKVIPAGLAHKDGRIQKGDRLLSINGKVLKDATHAELLKLLKTSRNDVVLVVARPQDLEDEEEVKTLDIDLVKSSAGLGFSIAGGKSSPRGDLPITVKKIFSGGAADRSMELNLDDEIVEVNGTKMANMTHFDAWTFLKSVPNGIVKLKIIPASR